MALRQLTQTAAFFLTCLAASLASAADMTQVHEHRAACVAALTTKAEPLITRLKAGDHSVEPELLSLTEKGFAIIGVSYKDGLRKPEADQMLESAKKAQKSMPAAELSQLQASCQVEGAQMLADVNMLERFMVTSAAQKRVTRITERAKP